MKIAFIGDVMLGRLVGAKYAQSPYDIVREDVREKILDADFVVANLESPVLSSNVDDEDHMVFQGNNEALAQFKWVNLFSTANNHINDCGDKGIAETLWNLQHNNISSNGIFIDSYKPFIIEKERIAIVTLTDLMNHEIPENSQYRLLRQGDGIVENVVREYADKGYMVIVFAHVGMLFTRYPNPVTVDYLHGLVDSGAGAIVTVHSHCLGGMEYYKNTPIFHSLGDFVMDGSSYRRRQSAFLTLNISDKQVLDWKITPTITDNNLQTVLPLPKIGKNMLKSYDKVTSTIERNLHKYAGFYKKQYNKEIARHSMSTLRYIYDHQGILPLLKVLILRLEEVRRVFKWITSDRSKVQSDTDALLIKKKLSQRDIYNN